MKDTPGSGLKERDEFGKDRWFYFLVSVDHQEIRRVAVEESEGVVDCPCLEALPVAAVNVAKAVFTADLLHRHALLRIGGVIEEVDADLRVGDPRTCPGHRTRPRTDPRCRPG